MLPREMGKSPFLEVFKGWGNVALGDMFSGEHSDARRSFSTFIILRLNDGIF